MGTLDGLVAIVAGAARGQGETEARLLVANGARAVLTDVLVDQGSAVAKDLGADALFIAHDVFSAEGWQEVVQTTRDTFGRVDILVNNAAISRPFKLIEPELFDEVYRVNQLACTWACGRSSSPCGPSVPGRSSTSRRWAPINDNPPKMNEVLVRTTPMRRMGDLGRSLLGPRATLGATGDAIREPWDLSNTGSCGRPIGAMMSAWQAAPTFSTSTR